MLFLFPPFLRSLPFSSCSLFLRPVLGCSSLPFCFSCFLDFGFCPGWSSLSSRFPFLCPTFLVYFLSPFICHLSWVGYPLSRPSPPPEDRTAQRLMPRLGRYPTSPTVPFPNEMSYFECCTFDGQSRYTQRRVQGSVVNQCSGCVFYSHDFYTHSCLRWRPYRVECTGSLPTSEVKRRRARLVLGWGTAREDLRVLPAFSLASLVRFLVSFSLARTLCSVLLLVAGHRLLCG